MADDSTTTGADQASLLRNLREATKQATSRKAKIREMTKTVEELTKERDKLKSTAAAPTDPSERERILQDKLDAAVTEVRGYKHRSAFDKAAKELKVRPEAYEDLYHLSGYKPDSDKPDYDKIKSLVSETVKSRSWLIESEAAASKHDEADASKGAPAGAGANGKQTGPAGAGADRGQSPHDTTQSTTGRHPGML